MAVNQTNKPAWYDRLPPRRASAAEVGVKSDLDMDVPADFMPLPEVKPKGRPIPSPAPASPPVQEKIRVNLARVEADSIQRIILRVVAVFASASCAITSIYFSNRWFAASQPGLIAFIMSVTIVATLTVAPEMALMLWKRSHRIMALVVGLIAMVAMLFSMSSTVGGIYNATSEVMAVLEGTAEEQAAEAGSTVAQAEITLLTSQKDRLVEAIAYDRNIASEYQDQINQALALGENPEARKNVVFASNRNAALARVRDAEAKLEEVEARIAVLLPDTIIAIAADDRPQVRDFNAWLGSQFGLPASRIEFLLAVFPAIFIDVIAPAMLAVAFSL